MEWAKDQYNKQYDVWVPWLEDMYLRYFTRDNKVSYSTRENLNKTKITPIPQLATAQENTHALVADQLGQDGLGRPVGDLVSREGVNRVERKGRDGRGGYFPGEGGSGEQAVGGVVGGGERVRGVVEGGVKGVGGLVGFSGGGGGGGGKGEEEGRGGRD